MMDFIMVPTILAIITLGIYKLFELFVCKKERLTIIEKMGEKFTPDMLGCLLTGMGLGLLVGYVICAATINGYTGTVDIGYRMNDVASLIYGACVLLLGGVGLLVAFVVEMNMNKK